MDQETAMQHAADHFAKAEEMTLRGSPASARLHVETAKGYVTMARELRIGRNRHSAYRSIEFKPVIVAEQPLTGDDVPHYDDDFAEASDPSDAVWPTTTDEVRTSGEVQAEQDEALSDT